MRDAGTDSPGLGKGIRRLARFRIGLGERFRFSELQIVLFWAVLTGIAGAWTSIGFREGTEWLHELFTGKRESYVESFRALPAFQRVLVPCLGGLLAGLTLLWGSRFKAPSNTSDYMEAVVVGDGNLSVRAGLVKSVSAWFSSASGASIGREGPLVQLASLAASLAGRFFSFPLARRRQLVACGAAAGIAGAYNAPLAGAFFVAEIVLGTVAMESFGPLVVSSVAATLVTRAHYGAEALYAAPAFHFRPDSELFLYLALGAAAGLCVPAYLSALKAGERGFGALKLAAPYRLALGGLVVGVLAIFHPEVAGNGRALVFSVLYDQGAWQSLAIILACKLAATAATFGSGAVGGVFTPTLFTGAAAGYLFGCAARALFPSWGIEPGAFALVGMGAFLAGATGAPVMAIVMLFELTLNYEVLLPAVIASVAGYSLCRMLGVRPLYGEALDRKGGAAVSQQLASLKVGDLLQKEGAALEPGASFGEVVRAFLHSRHDILYVAEEGRLRGLISLHDIKSHLDHPELEELLIARDVMHDEPPRLFPDETMSEALDRFRLAGAERLPVTAADGTLLGTLGRGDVLLFLAGKPKAGNETP